MTLNSDAAAELAATIGEPLGGAGAAYYFHPDTLAKGKELGLGGMQFYMLGRGGVLGDAHSDVVASAFGYFHRDAVASLWNSAKEKMSPADAATTYMECCADVGRSALGAIDGLEGFVDAGTAAIDATNRAGLALFAGFAAQPLVDDVPGKAQQVAAILRELRGSVHINALLATGIVPEVAHAIKRPEMTAPFGWDPAPDTSGVTDAMRATAETLTNQMVGVSLTGLSDDQAAALAAGATAIGAAHG